MTRDRIEFIRLVAVVMSITCWVGCSQHATNEDSERQEVKPAHRQILPPPTRDPYLYTATITVDGQGNCSQDVMRGVTDLGVQNWIQVSASNKDTVTYVLGGLAVDAVMFPTNNGSPSLSQVLHLLRMQFDTT